MKALWTGSLCFGRLEIPVRLFSASRPRAMRFTMLDKTDLTPIGYAWIRKDNDKPVAPHNIARGYEYETGQYVILEEEDFKAANVRKTEVIEILGFTTETDIDTMYFERPYYVAPDRGSARMYVLLREALRRVRKVGIARFVFRNREYLAALKVEDRALVLNQLRYAEDIQPVDEFDLPIAAEYSNREMDMTLSLIERLSHPFNIAEYKDAYSEELRTIIEEKRAGLEPRRLKGKRSSSRKLADKDILPLLEKSLKEGIKD